MRRCRLECEWLYIEMAQDGVSIWCLVNESKTWEGAECGDICRRLGSEVRLKYPRTRILLLSCLFLFSNTARISDFLAFLVVILTSGYKYVVLMRLSSSLTELPKGQFVRFLLSHSASTCLRSAYGTLSRGVGILNEPRRRVRIGSEVSEGDGFRIQQGQTRRGRAHDQRAEFDNMNVCSRHDVSVCMLPLIRVSV